MYFSCLLPSKKRTHNFGTSYSPQLGRVCTTLHHTHPMYTCMRNIHTVCSVQCLQNVYSQNTLITIHVLDMYYIACHVDTHILKLYEWLFHAPYVQGALFTAHTQELQAHYMYIESTSTLHTVYKHITCKLTLHVS